jgi:hypothetical protein
MKELEIKLMAVITETMPKGEDGKIQDRLLHSDLIVAVTEALRIYDVSSLLKAEREATKEEIREWLRDEDFEGLAERL